MSLQQISHLPSSSTSVPIPSIMKDISSSKNVRTTLYPRKRPSSHGISKARAQKDSPPPYTSHPNIHKSPRNAKVEQLARKQREAKASVLRREGVYLEEEYREEIQRYMHEMEVCIIFFPPKNTAQTSPFFSNIQCVLLSPWINNPRLNGTCDLVSLISS